MAGDVTKLRRTVGGCRIVIIVLSVLIIALVVALAVTVVKMQEKLEEVQSAHCKQGLQSINLDPPKILTPFHDLTAEEIHNVKEFLYSQDDLNLVVATELSVNSSYIFTMELKIPNKAQTLNYLDKGRQQPAREANVVIFRGDTPETYIQEYTVGPLPLPTYKKDSRTRPFRFRPFTHPELEDVLTKIGKEVQTEVGTLLEESYGGKIWTEGCEKNCLGFQLQIPESSAITGNTHNRRFWLWLYQVVEYFSLHPLDFLVLTDVTGNTEDQYNIVKITYAGNTFNSLKELKTAYELNTVNKVKVPFPVNDDQLFSSMHRRGKEFPEKPARRPLEFEPDGKRYSINGRHISYMGWQFHVRLSPISGPQLFDIRYQGERIVYELSLQEIGVFYSAHNPAHRFSDFADSVAMVGTRVRTLVTGSDCPEHSTYLSATYATESSEEASVVDRAFCVFEHNTGTPLRRHHARSVFEGIFYEGVQDVVLTVRTITTVVNYDYIIDFIFHQNGGIEVKIIPTGYILTSFRMPEEDNYGFRLRDHIIGNIHHHIFNYKVDLDIKGTSNRFETLNLVPEEVDNSKWSTDPNAKYAQTRMVKNLVKSEKAAAVKYNFDAPKYITFYNNEERTTYGVPRAYRLLMRGMSKQIIPEGKGQEPSVSWARYQMAVTKYKEAETKSSSLYAIWDGADPVVNFQNYIDDDENIVDVDQVTWVTMGVHHIPHMEDFPVTPTVGLELKFFLLPNNYFDEDPAIGSGDAIRIDPVNPIDLKKGFKINRYGRKENANCKPAPDNFDKEIENNPESMFDPIE